MTGGDTAGALAWIAAAADAKGAEDLVGLDMRGLVSYTDSLLICTARNERQARAIVEEVRLRLKDDHGLLPGGVDGEGSAGWVVVDYLDVVLHVFTAEDRERFGLEDLWREAPRLSLGLGESSSQPAPEVQRQANARS